MPPRCTEASPPKHEVKIDCVPRLNNSEAVTADRNVTTCLRNLVPEEKVF